ncbi:type VI secretion system tip protein TssI/VgrG [Sorangium sp. So ce1036]|uniref:type VI secretion system Vgr family protein n=1 Tax=Sorangium sp. So ce1036 TaxID=3133328 RepID=UPI003EFD71A0
MSRLSLWFASREESLSVRRFAVREQMSSLFEVTILAVSEVEDLNLDGIVGKAAAFKVESNVLHSLVPARVWAGLCAQMEQVQAEPTGLSTYRLRIVPSLFRATLRRNNRIFQHLSIPDIVLLLLKEWEIEPDVRLNAKYPAYEYRVQYGETDFAFLCRLLEEAGISFYFAHRPGDGMGAELTRLVLCDAPQRNEPRSAGPIAYVDNPNEAAGREFVSEVVVSHEVRPGHVTLRDFDFRMRPDYQLLAEAKDGPDDELRYEHYHYLPGAFVVEPGKGGDTPVADDRGVARVDMKEAEALATRSLEGERRGRRSVRYRTNALDLCPGVVLSIGQHPRKELAPGQALLVVASSFEGEHNREWTTTGEAVFASHPYRPARRTPRPRVVGVQSAIVVGPPGEEIHTDEFGRVRVQFHWDREGRFSDESSCWIRVSQGWAGSRYGLIAIPRVGQEVLVDFFDGDPDRPVIVGRVYNNTTRVPYTLPAEKTKSGWKSDSSPGSNGFNELSFDDAAGRELIHVQAQRDYSEIIKHDQRSTVLSNRSASVGASDAVTVGGSQSFSVLKSQSHTIGEQQTNNIGAGRTSIIGTSDTVDAGDSQNVTVGDGVGYTINKDKTVQITNGVASIRITPEGIFIDANGNLEISAGGLLKLSGAEVQIDGGPNVFINTTSAKAPSVATIGKAKAPSAPGGPGGGGATSVAAEILRGGGAVELPGGIADVEVRGAALGLARAASSLPLTPAAAPAALQIGPAAGAAIQEEVRAPSSPLAALVRTGTGAVELFRLAKGESLASLPSTLDVLGPVLTEPRAALGGLSASDLGSLVNAGSAAGIVHVGGAGGQVAQFLALRTAAAPRSVNGGAVRAEAQATEASGVPAERAYARALSTQGVALYQGDMQGGFAKVEP